MKEFIVTENLDEGFSTTESKEKAEKQLYEGEIDAYLPIEAETEEEAIEKFYEEQDRIRKKVNE